MKKNPQKIIVLVNLIIAALCLVTILMHFIPGFTFPTKEGGTDSVSIFRYAVGPSSCKDFKSYLTQEFMARWNNEYYINDTIHSLVLLFILSIATMILCIVFRGKVGAPIITGFLCAVWVWVFPNRLLRLHSLFPVYIAVGVIIILLWVFDLYLYAQRKKIRDAEKAASEEILY